MIPIQQHPMRRLLLPLFLGASLILPLHAVPGSAELSIIAPATLGTPAYAEWVDGVEKKIVHQDKNGTVQPLHYLWSSISPSDAGFLSYGDSKTPGVRHLRIGFEKAVNIGSILARGGGQVSVLKPDAAYPGDLADDSEWIPAQRLQNGAVSDEEAGQNEVVVWTLPETVATRALRFTHTAAPSDQNYAGVLGGAALLADRWANLAPQALATASDSDQNAFRLNDGHLNGLASGWENIPSRDGIRPTTIAADPEWTLLVWPKPVTLGGVALLGNEFGAVEIQTYTGSVHPREAAESDWQTIRTLSGVKPQYPALLDLQPVGFDAPVTTRALRLRFTGVFDETNVHPHLKGRTREGKRVSLDEWMALQPLDTSALASAILPIEKMEAHAPIPIRFTLPDDGEVTLVIEDASGKRLRNLVSQTPFPKGENIVWWDGTDDIARDPAAPDHGIYAIPPEFVAPGTYTVRGLWHKPLDLHYEFSVYSPGDPPWPTEDTTGGWMTNHTPASATVFIPGNKAPGGQPLIGIGAWFSEGGSAFSWVNLEGKKVGGRGWIGGNWTGAPFLAVDSGSGAESGVAAYVGSAFPGNKKYGIDGKIEIRLTKLTNLVAAGDQPVLKEPFALDPLPDVSFPTGTPPAPYLGGIAVYNGLLVFSETVGDKITFIDAKAGKILGAAPISNPRGLAFDSQGRLLVLSGKSLLRYPSGTIPPNPPPPETLVANLDDPRGITVDTAGNIYIADQGESQQVKVYSQSGQPLMVYGHPGAPQAGPYDPLHMNHPKGLAIDSDGRLWVAEDDYQPKRVSVWNTNGTLWKAWYGPAQYGGGGMLDPGDKTKYLYNGMEFHLDWNKGTSDLARVYYRVPADLPLAIRSAPPECPAYFNGKRYLSDAYNSAPASGQDSVFLFLDKGDGNAVIPVAAMGSANKWDLLKTEAFKSRWPAGLDPAGDMGKNQALFIWSDLNGDGQVQPEEVAIRPGNGGYVTIGDDGSFLASFVGTSDGALQAMRYQPVRFTGKGAPVYDIDAGVALAPAQRPASDGGGQILSGADGWLVMTTPPPPFSKLGLGGALNGKPNWSYPSLWPGLHPSHTSCIPDHPGMLVGTTRLLGNLVTPGNSEAGPLFFLNSNQGDIYAFTQDGLFVSQLFQDVRQGKLWEMPAALRNMGLNDLTLHDENFFPGVSQTSDGNIYLMTGANMSLVRIDNLDTVHRIAPAPIEVSADDLKQAANFVVDREAVRQAAQGSGLLTVAIRDGNAPPLDGKADNWTFAQWVAIDHRGVAAYFNATTKPYDVNGAVAVADGKLYAAWKTGDPNLLQNAGDVPNALFKSGGALDLMIGADPSANPDRTAPVAGDERLLISQVGGKTRALLYRAVVPGTAETDKIAFNAPWHGITLDQVEDVSEQVQLTADGAGNYEIAIPLLPLGLKPQAGMQIKGDIGLLRGDGKQTTQRVYWTNKATAIVSDVPSEAELTPRLWGTWKFQ